ncbi:P-loop containing nucleoside triphosphatehydrolases superfamily protein [Striga asiatica]|uniref:P-loop containing nucleoside triphosphatehydrolases superfamily protein n=1 Tax=Striga asiatica TaxID=4170 RepID=A0A5A7PYX1_STRAF|nr:P-loop containing nucleoside triphosphatehydrolases superfamily protein [Striga asiatica]
MFLTQKLPRIHSRFSISTLSPPKPQKLFCITSTLLSKTKPGPDPTPLSHFSTAAVAAAPPPQKQGILQLSLENLFFPPDTDASSLRDTPLSARVLKGSNIVLSKYAGDGAEVDSADFVKSSVRTEDCPADGSPEFALVGRSNVGKSSLLNSLVRRKKLALTSKKPGKTQCINHFRINDSWYLVDLPGYGFELLLNKCDEQEILKEKCHFGILAKRYAVAPHEVRTDWAKFTKDYFLKRPTLVSVFLLIDASIPAKKIDLEYASWLGQNEIPMTLVFTKCDKRKKKKNGGKRPEENVQDFLELIRDFFQTAPPWIMTSSVTNQGRDEILLHVSQLRNYWLKH